MCKCFSIALQLGKLFRAALHSEVQFSLFPGSLETWLLVRESPHGQQRWAICSEWNHPPSKAILILLEPWGSAGSTSMPHWSPKSEECRVCAQSRGCEGDAGSLEHIEYHPAGCWYWEHLGSFLFNKGRAWRRVG